jgi:hypothetical protein
MNFLDALRQDDEELWEVPRMLRADLLEAARTLSQQEARYHVDTYYSLQHFRIQSQNQTMGLASSDEPNAVTSYLRDRFYQLERQIQRELDVWSQVTPLGQWSRAQVGIGPVLAAGLLAHLDSDPPPTVGHWWRFAGLDPSDIWEKNTKRPWNAKLKVILWKVGQSMVKCSGREDCLYGQLYKRRKLYEQERNAQGVNADQAEKALKTKNIGKETDAYKHYSEGRLPPGHIQARSERWTAKIFLSHYHEAATVAAHGRLPPKPFAIGRLGHTTWIEPHHMDMIPQWSELRKLAS